MHNGVNNEYILLNRALSKDFHPKNGYINDFGWCMTLCAIDDFFPIFFSHFEMKRKKCYYIKFGTSR